MIGAINDPLVKLALPRYVNVVNDKLPALFLIAKRIEAKFSKKFLNSQLWNLHDHLMKKFEMIREKIDKGEIAIEDLPIQKCSLLDLKIELAKKILQSCEFCERRCGVNRLKGETGFCKAGLEWKIFGAHAHYGEEPELVPSGTIFQAACSMACVYCQNAPESINPDLGETWKVNEIVGWIEKAKEKGIININWVGGSPTCWLFNILSALKHTNVNIAQIWNSNSYYSEKTAKLINGVIDLYLLDFRYFSNNCAVRLSSAPHYVEAAKRNHLMAKRAGELIIRILVMPNHIECDAKPILKWIKENLGEYTRINILSQYRPCWKAFEYREIARPLRYEEWANVVEYAKKIGLKNLIL